MLIWTRCSDRPFLHHLNLCSIVKHAYRLNHIEITRFNGLYNASFSRWNHNLVTNGFCLLNFANALARHYGITGLDCRFKCPLFLKVKSISIDTSSDEYAHYFFKGSKRALDTIVNLSKQTRTKRYRQSFFRIQNRFSRTDTARIFIYLNYRFISV